MVQFYIKFLIETIDRIGDDMMSEQKSVKELPACPVETTLIL